MGCDSSAQRANAAPNIRKIWIDVVDATEHCSGLWKIAGTFVEIGKHIGPTQVMWHRTLREGETLFEKRDRRGNVVAIGKRTCHHNSPLGHKFGARRSGAQLIPQFSNLRPLTHRAIAIGKNRMLVGGIAQQSERFEFTSSRLPLLLAVQRESVQLVHGRDGRRLVNKFLEDSRSVGKAFCLEMLGGLRQSTFNPFGASGADCATQLLTNFTRQIDWRRIASTRGTTRHRSRRLVAYFSDERSVFR